MSNWGNQENSLSVARTEFYQTCCYLIPKVWLKGAASLQAIIGLLLGVVWGGYEEFCGQRKEMLDLFRWVKEQKKEPLVEKQPRKGPQINVWKEWGRDQGPLKSLPVYVVQDFNCDQIHWVHILISTKPRQKRMETAL